MACDGAEAAYTSIRESTTDVAAIARYNNLKPERIQRIKEYLFNNPVWTGADGEIAAAWHRLRTGCGTQTDMLLLKHETAEMWLMNNKGMGYSEAHRKASTRYDWEFGLPGGDNQDTRLLRTLNNKTTRTKTTRPTSTSRAPRGDGRFKLPASDTVSI